MNPNCEECGGFGMVPLRVGDVVRPPAFTRCSCVLREDILYNAEQVMPGLLSALPVKRSPLSNKTTQDVWVTAPERWFSSHLRHVAIRQSPIWVGRVVSDADLMTSWLATIALKGVDILDADSFGVSTKFLTLPDLVVPSDLLVIRMGVKAARNSACAEVLVEAINLRKSLKKPTWVWDQPEHPLAPGHLFWGGDVGSVLASFQPVRVGLVEENLNVSLGVGLGGEVRVNPEPQVGTTPVTQPRRSLRGPR